jgi:AcrR family transcriptional regulator
VPRRSREAALATRATIVERAMTVASTEGLEGLTIGRLAGDVGMSKSGLIGHFQTKEALQLAALENAGEVFRREVVEPARAHPPGAERLRAIGEHWISYLERRVFPGGCFFAAATLEYDDRPGPVRDRLVQGQAAWQSYIAHHAKLAGHPDPEQLSFEMYSLVLGTNAAFQLFGDGSVFGRSRITMSRLVGTPGNG